VTDHTADFSNGTQGAFIARLAHELRNPLAPIRMALQIMQLSDGDVGTTRAARVIIDRQLKQLSRLVDDLADVSQPGHQAMRLKLEQTRLKTVIDAALDRARPQLESRQNALQLEVADEAAPLYADVERLGQALANVLVNASKFSPLASRITLSAACTADEVVFQITDQGVGIPTSMLTRIFEPFVQVNRNGAGTHDGLGIGLALTRNVLVAHGGTASAESEGQSDDSRRGARITLRLPRGSMNAASSEDRAIEEPAGSAKLRILIADDNRDAAHTLSIMLAYEGHEVRTAHDGLEVLAIGQLFEPDLILLDIGMPVMDGYQTARQIRERPWGRDAYLVALTGWGQDADRDAALAHGFQRHLVKPTSAENLSAVIADAMRVRRSAANR